MTDSEQTIDRSKVDEQPDSPGASAPGDAATPSGEPGPASDAEAASAPGDAATPSGDPGPASDAEAVKEPAQAGVQDDGGDAAEIEGDLDELVKTAAQRDEYLALAQRTQADFENYRKRVARESANAQARGVIGLAKELLPALDNLDRALDAAAQDDPLLEGVRFVRSELGAALARVGIESFSPVGEPFDPAVHEAMTTIEQPEDGAESGTVVEVYQPGYRLGANVIRPARVVVAA
jgi:molecular chaperone GrpE